MTTQIEVYLVCSVCGRSLNISTSLEDMTVKVTVDPCSYCMDEEHQDGYDIGYDAGERARDAYEAPPY